MEKLTDEQLEEARQYVHSLFMVVPELPEIDYLFRAIEEVREGRRVVEIGEKDEWYDNSGPYVVYTCPACRGGGAQRYYERCPCCGVKLRWKD